MPIQRAKKPVSVLAISMSITKTGKKIDPKPPEKSELQQVACIYSPAQYGKFSIEIFIDSNNKDNAMLPSFVRKLDPRICNINVIF